MTLATTITLKKIPTGLYARLKASAKANRRSLNSEVLVRLEQALARQPIDARRRLARIDAVRAAVSLRLTADEVDAYKKEGRR